MGERLVQPSLFFDYDIAGRTPFSMGLVQTVLAVLGGLFVLAPFPKIQSSPLIPLALFSLVTLLISTLYDYPHLSNFSGKMYRCLPMVQFPWRFLSVQALATSLFIALLRLVAYRTDYPSARFSLTAFSLLA